MAESITEKKDLSIGELKEQARQIRINIIKSLCAAGSGHSGGPLGLADIFSVLYLKVMRNDPKDPFWKQRDRLILSAGHVIPVRYAAMAQAGYFARKELLTLRKLGTRLQGHPHHLDLPGLETSSGSLGQGLGIAAGIALGAKMNKETYTTFCCMGDGELQEGSIWEAAMFASHYKLDNLIGFVDRNYLQIDGNTEEVMGLDPLPNKWKEFGWTVVESEGHDVEKVLAAFNSAKDKSKKEKKPAIILFRTKMGKGVSFMEDDFHWHGMPPNVEQAKKALTELGEDPNNLGFDDSPAADTKTKKGGSQ